jgi:hypothetical protein
MKTKMNLNEEHNHSLVYLFVSGKAIATTIVINRRNEMVSVLQYMTTLAEMMTKLQHNKFVPMLFTGRRSHDASPSLQENTKKCRG